MPLPSAWATPWKRCLPEPIRLAVPMVFRRTWRAAVSVNPQQPDQRCLLLNPPCFFAGCARDIRRQVPSARCAGHPSPEAGATIAVSDAAVCSARPFSSPTHVADPPSFVSPSVIRRASSGWASAFQRAASPLTTFTHSPTSQKSARWNNLNAVLQAQHFLGMHSRGVAISHVHPAIVMSASQAWVAARMLHMHS